MPYERTPEVKDELLEFKRRSDVVLKSLPSLIQRIGASSSEEIVSHLKSEPYFTTLLFSIFKGEVRRLTSGDSHQIEYGRNNVNAYLSKMAPVIEMGLKTADRLLQSEKKLF